MISTPRLPLATLALAAMLAACGGGGGSTPGAPGVTPAAPAPAPAPRPTALSGTVAVGAPITGGMLRIVDADGHVVASDVAVAADGTYPAVTLTGTGPWRIEACGHAGPNYLCVYSVAASGGTANVTPLTTATVLLASGQAPETLMTGTAPALTAAAVDSAQNQLRTGLASVLASNGVAADIDFVSGTLAAGSRNGYDGVLDAIGVNVGQDGAPFVQITPRVGSGNLYLQQGSSSGSVTAAAGAEALQLSGLEALFRNMSQSLASAAACSSSSTGIQRSLAANARMTLDGPTAVSGAAAVAEGLCSFFGSGDDGNTPMWGSRLMSPVLGRCDLSGAAPVCGVSFTIQDTDGSVQPVGSSLAVTREGSAWKFLGDLLPISINASAKAQRNVRIDGDTAVVNYDRAFAFEIAALPGLACARVSQRDAAGSAVTIGYYKPMPGAWEQGRLSLWTRDGWGNTASTDPLSGALRSADDTWIGLPEGAAGDAAIRNFYRGGRSVQVSLYADGNCSTAFAIDGRSTFDVDVQGLPPVWSALEALPWPQISDRTRAGLRALALAPGASSTLDIGWSFPHGPLGVEDISVCGDRGSCGKGGNGRLGDTRVRPSATTATVRLRNEGTGLEPNDSKMLALSGRSGDGVDLQANFSVCPGVAAGEICH